MELGEQDRPRESLLQLLNQDGLSSEPPTAFNPNPSLHSDGLAEDDAVGDQISNPSHLEIK